MMKGLKENWDPSVELREAAKLLLIGDNQKAELFQGFLAKHFFRGMVEVSKFPYKLKNNKLFLTFHLIFNPIPNKKYSNFRCHRTEEIVLY